MITLLLVVLAQAATAGAPGMLVERRLAEAIPLQVTDSVQIRLVGGGAARWFVVEGIFERPADPARITRNEYEVVFHLPDLEAMLPVGDRVDRFAVALAPSATPDSAARWIETLAFGTRVYGAQELASRSSATFEVISRFHRAIGVITILASAIFLLCVMIIRIDERRSDVGTLRLIGISRGSIFRAVAGEAVLVATLGSLAGALLGIGISRVVNQYYMRLYDTSLSFALVTPRIVVLAATLGLVLGAFAGTVAAMRVLRLPPGGLGER